MHKVRAQKVTTKALTFDSKKEAAFFEKYVYNCGYRYKVHPRFKTVDLPELHGLKFRKANYTPDFVIYDENGAIKHVYDVKNGFDTYSIDAAAKLRFKQFQTVYNVPVEVVVMYASHFKTKVLGTTKTYQPKQRTNVDYNWWEV